MATHVNYYDLLEVSPLASQEVIRAAYKSLMQRDHPDKNPGDAASAERTSQRAQAYGVLCDADKRAQYDASLKAQAPSPGASDASNASTAYTAYQPLAGRAPRSQRTGATAKSASPSWVWLLIVVVILSASAAIFLLKKQSAPAKQLAVIVAAFESGQMAEEQRRQAFNDKESILDSHPALRAQHDSLRLKATAGRTLDYLDAPLVVKLSVNLPTPALAPVGAAVLSAEYLLTIPQLTVRAGSYEPDKVLQHLKGQKEGILQKLAANLAADKSTALLSPKAQSHLKLVILESLIVELGIRKLEEYPSTLHESPGRYGVVEVLLPDAFTLIPLNAPAVAPARP